MSSPRYDDMTRYPDAPVRWLSPSTADRQGLTPLGWLEVRPHQINPTTPQIRISPSIRIGSEVTPPSSANAERTQRWKDDHPSRGHHASAELGHSFAKTMGNADGMNRKDILPAPDTPTTSTHGGASLGTREHHTVNTVRPSPRKSNPGGARRAE